MTFDRLQLLHDILTQVDQSVILDGDTIQERHPAALTPLQVSQLQVLAADVQALRDSIQQAGPNPRLHFDTLRRHRREAPLVWGAIAPLLPADSLHAFYQLTATGRAALDLNEGA